MSKAEETLNAAKSALSKFDINGLIKGVKSTLNPTAHTPDVEADDELGVKLARISTLVQTVAHQQAESAKLFTTINKLVNEVYAEVEVLRQVNADSAEDVIDKSV